MHLKNTFFFFIFSKNCRFTNFWKISYQISHQNGIPNFFRFQFTISFLKVVSDRRQWRVKSFLFFFFVTNWWGGITLHFTFNSDRIFCGNYHCSFSLEIFNLVARLFLFYYKSFRSCFEWTEQKNEFEM